jgi:hypothetical protein
MGAASVHDLIEVVELLKTGMPHGSGALPLNMAMDAYQLMREGKLKDVPS